MKRISVWTIILILVSAYFVYLSIAEYRTSSTWEKYADEQFEIHLEDTPRIPTYSNLISMSEIELEEWHNENRIKRIHYEVRDSENMDRYILWGVRAKIHFQMALIFILLTVISWRFDSLLKTKK